MLFLLDVLLNLAHLALIAFNLFGWLVLRLRRLNLLCLVLTGLSWFGLGLYYGLGYCPLTDWQWQIKLARGETDLPNSYIKYLIDRLTGLDADPVFVDWLTGAAYFLALASSLIVNFKSSKSRN